MICGQGFGLAALNARRPYAVTAKRETERICTWAHFNLSQGNSQEDLLAMVTLGPVFKSLGSISPKNIPGG